MTEKKNAQPRKTELSAMNISANLIITPRQARVIEALSSTTDWLWREEIDRISGASNGPEIIRQLRKKLGYEAIEMEHVEIINRDGQLAKPGHYRLTAMGHERLAEMVGK